MAISVAVAVGDVADKLVDNIKDKAQNLLVAPWNHIDVSDNSKKPDMGPVISKEHMNKIKNYIDKGEKEGASLILDGRDYKLQGYENGFFLGPTLFDNVNKEMAIYKEEIFGPVLSVVRAKNYEEALDLVNTHQFGNGASIYTSNGEISRDFTTVTSRWPSSINVGPEFKMPTN